jgi:hypothetical protein
VFFASVTLMVTGVVGASGEGLAAPRLVGGSAGLESADGVVAIEWKDAAGEEGVDYELQQAETRDFAGAVTRYRGPDRTSVLTGLREGVHFFRVRRVGGTDWSPPLTVRVKFIGRSRMLLLLGTGFVVAALTAGTIIVGPLKPRKGGLTG